MKIESLKELNQRWWYRLFRVIYIFGLGYTLLLFVAIVIGENEPREVFDREKSKIVCLGDNAKTFSFKELGLYSSSNIKLNDVAEWCDLDPVPSGLIFPASSDAIVFSVNKTKIEQGHTVIKRYRTKGSWFATIGFALLTALFIFLLFEIGRRVFYYVFFGTIRPKKN